MFDEEFFNSIDDNAATAISREKREAPPALEPGESNGRSTTGRTGNGKSKLAAHGLWHQSKKVRHLEESRASAKTTKGQHGHQTKTTTTTTTPPPLPSGQKVKKTMKESDKVSVSKKSIHLQQELNKKKQHQKKIIKEQMLADDEDMLADASGSGAGPDTDEISPPTTSQPRSQFHSFIYLNPFFNWKFLFVAEIFRCSLLIQEPFSAALENRDSDDFEQLSDRFTVAVDQIYASATSSEFQGPLSTTVHTFESVPGELSYIRVNFDIDAASKDDEDDKAIEATIRQAVRSGQIGSFYVKTESLTIRTVIGSS